MAGREEQTGLSREELNASIEIANRPEGGEESLSVINRFMIGLPPHTALNEIDTIICDKNYNGVRDNTAAFTGIKCKNYRAVDIAGSDNTKNQIYLTVGSIDLDNPVNQDDFSNNFDKLIPYIKNPRFCSDTNGIISKLTRQGKLEPGKVIYFKGAFTRFPSSWMKSSKPKSEIDEAVLNIYKNATRGILIKILPLLKRLGYETIIVDPAPGYHPGTVGKDDDQKFEGLVKLYETMGLKKILCKNTTEGMIMRSTRGVDRDIIDYLDFLPPRFVMLGEISEMVKQLESGEGVFGRALAFTGLSEDARAILDLIQVPFKYGSVNKQVLTTEEIAEIKGRTDNDLEYRQKYMKYKNKYLKLKSEK